MLNPKYIELRHIINGEDSDEYDRIEVYIDGVLAQEFNRDSRTDIDAESEAFLDAVCYLCPDIEWDYT
jgi:hypothetical protein